tara:strand:- start:874 stop:1545 length:672 start_codon:yes stop_codon:yes gene_type:complete
MKRSAQTSQWDNISQRVRRYEKNIVDLDSHIAKYEKDISEQRSWLSEEISDRRDLHNKLNYYLALPLKEQKFWKGEIRRSHEQISEINRNISHLYGNIDELKARIVERNLLKEEATSKRDDVLTAYSDPKHNEQYDIWPQDDDLLYETIYLPNGKTKTRRRQPVYLPSGEVADYQDAYWRYPHPIGPLSNEQTHGQYFDNDGNLVLDLNPNPTNQVPYTVDWI